MTHQIEEQKLAVASTVVAGYSGTEGAGRALLRAAGLSDPTGKLVVVHVLEPPQSISSRVDDIEPEQRQRQSDILGQGEELAAAAQAEVETLAALGNPADELLRIAVERGAEVLVIGRGRLPRVSLLRQSVCEKLVREASTSVLVVP